MKPDPNTIVTNSEDDPIVSLHEATPPPASEEAPAPNPAESGEGVSPDPEPAADPPKADPPEVPKSSREKLIAKLTGEEDEPKPEAAEAPASEEAVVPAPKAQDAPKAPDAPELVELNKPVTNEDIKALKPGEARRHINRLLDRVKEAEPMAKGYREIVDLCEKNGMTPADYRAWVALGVGIQTGNEEAVKSFEGLARKLGIVQEASPPAAVMTPELDAWLEKQAKDLEMSPGAVAALRAKLGPVKAPAPAPQPRPQPQPQPQTQQQPQADPMQVASVRATTEINRIADEYEKRIGADNFKALEPRIMAELAKRKGKHPDSWPDIFRSVVDSELARAPKPAQVGSSLRPGGGQPPPAKPAFKTERERVIHQYTG